VDVRPASNKRGTARRQESQRGGSAAAPLDAHASALFQRLRVLRRELADERNVPPYVIFSDATLREMAQRRPESRTAFAQIGGVGSQKLDAFATVFTRAIEGYCDEHGLATMEQVETNLKTAATVTPTSREQADGSDRAGNSGRGERAGRARSVRTAQITWQFFRDGKTVDEIAQARGLAPRTIVDHLCEGLEHGEAIDLQRLVAPQRQAEIRAALLGDRGGAEMDKRAFNDIRLRAVKEALESAGERGVTYEEIRLVRAALAAQSTGA
jgi:ATP-dependent DNA helicase RecQ